jgi:hypothetical protein
MIQATRGAFHVRANVGKLAKRCSIHFDARREFASRVGAPHHYYGGLIHRHGLAQSTRVASTVPVWLLALNEIAEVLSPSELILAIRL